MDSSPRRISALVALIALTLLQFEGVWASPSCDMARGGAAAESQAVGSVAGAHGSHAVAESATGLPDTDCPQRSLGAAGCSGGFALPVSAGAATQQTLVLESPPSFSTQLAELLLVSSLLRPPRI